MPLPIVTSITPNFCNIAGFSSNTATVYIQGSNLSFPNQVTAVTIGGNTCGFTLESTPPPGPGIVYLRVYTVPAHAAGAADVALTNPSGTTTVVGGFTFINGPAIARIAIPYGPTIGGFPIGISGSGFTDVTSVTMGGTAATIVKIINDNDMIITAPPHVAGVVDIVITSPEGVATAVGAFTYQLPATPVMNVYIFDDCCHIWISTDSGDTWLEGITPTGADDNLGNNADTLQDPWSDMMMAINDGDYLTCCAVDFDYTNTFGVIATSPKGGQTHTWTLFDPELNAPAAPQNYNTWTEFVSGAYSIAAILMAPNIFFNPNVDNFYPRISRDHGATWSDVTGGLPTNVAWARAALSAGATTQYLKPSGNSSLAGDGVIVLNPARIFKSTDSGNTWSQLLGGPTLNGSPATGASDYESQQRLRCSKNGLIVGFVGCDSVFWKSIDGGTTWTSKDFHGFFRAGATLQTGDQSDFGMSDDGQTIIVGFNLDINGGLWPALALTKDGGATWTDISSRMVYPALVGGALGPDSQTFPNAPGFTQCNVSPDGMGIVVTWLYIEYFYSNAPGDQAGIMYANVSLDGGATFRLCSYYADAGEVGSFLGLFTGTFITPSTPLPPPTPPPPKPTLLGGYIIERFDNRLWPTVENAWCVDCGFTLHRPTPTAALSTAPATGAITGVGQLVGGKDYSSGTTAKVIDANGLGPGTGAVPILTIAGGVITAIAFSPPGQGYIFPEISFYDPANTGSGASATLLLDTSSHWIASAPVFASVDVGSIIRAGYGVAEITQFIDSQNVIVSIRVPVAQVLLDALQPDGSIVNEQKNFAAGFWTMTKPISTLYLPALQGFTITGIADGQVIPPTLVPASGPNAGIVVLPQPASAIIVGLAFEAQLQSVYLDTGEPTVQGQRKKVAAVTARIEASAAFEIGANQPDGAAQSPPQIDPTWQDMTAAPIPAVAPYNSLITPLYSGDVRIPVSGGYDVRGQVAVQQRKPLPLQVLAFVPEVLAGDKPAQEAPKKEGRNG
jgi:hypothetical protein